MTLRVVQVFSLFVCASAATSATALTCLPNIVEPHQNELIAAREEAAHVYHRLFASIFEKYDVGVAFGTLTLSQAASGHPINDATSYTLLTQKWEQEEWPTPNLEIRYVFENAAILNGIVYSEQGAEIHLPNELDFENTCQQYCGRYPKIGVRTMMIIEAPESNAPTIWGSGICPITFEDASPTFHAALVECLQNGGCADWLR